MGERKKGLILFEDGHPFYPSLKENSDLSLSVDWESEKSSGRDTKDLKKRLGQFDFSILGGNYCLQAFKAIQHRSVGSHFLKYVDLVSKENGQLWGHSVFSLVFREVLLKSIQNQDFKGSVIFLGQSALAFPVIDVLAGFGFEDFVFLKLPNSRDQLNLFDQNDFGLLGVEVSAVDSGAFIQSQKEYSFCFVMESVYPQQTLEDMSYFHFLSTNSLVFDLMGNSNFLFKEVKALDVDVMPFPSIQEIWAKTLCHQVDEIASKMGK